eukprot:GHVR01161597.1.p1 GENE.GHVR01161597.1~~GHVR01161597.1.p1  ORF type:complete len:133 (+),score=3.27 GHVR01161597.1:61-459(+)
MSVTGGEDSCINFYASPYRRRSARLEASTSEMRPLTTLRKTAVIIFFLSVYFIFLSIYVTTAVKETTTNTRDRYRKYPYVNYFLKFFVNTCSCSLLLYRIMCGRSQCNGNKPVLHEWVQHSHTHRLPQQRQD